MSAKTFADLVRVLENGGEGGVVVAWLVPYARNRRETLHRVAVELTMTEALAPLTWRIRQAPAAERIEVSNGSRILFILADDRSCRGLSADLVISDGPPPSSARMSLLVSGGDLWDEGVTLS